MNVLNAAPPRREWTPIGEVKTRAIETTGGRIAYIVVSPRDAPARLTVRVIDASGAIDCVFLGRRLIAGLEPGATVGIEGRVAPGEDVKVMFNPRYELRLA
ncbi:MAG: OB-fold nucleic acid binding domain-containing protein [Demequinaceae bacterium]|nr:OB-fold nucleic acid binding domain-containing protein [Demequinaceae bacterium]